MKVQFHPAAKEEFIAAVEYYEAALPGLGRRFLVAVRKTTALARSHVNAGAQTHDAVKRLVIAGFPYDLVYWVREEALEVLAVAHQRRRPGYWRERIPR